jgi:hypothetical protein
MQKQRSPMFPAKFGRVAVLFTNNILRRVPMTGFGSSVVAC